MNAIALCHNRDLQKTNGRIIVLGSGCIPLMQTATWVNMQPYSQSERVFLHFDSIMVCFSVCLSAGCGCLPVCVRSIHSSTQLSVPSCHSQINPFSRPRQSSRWLNWLGISFFLFFPSVLFPKRAAKPVAFFFVDCKELGKLSWKFWAKRSVNKRSNQAWEQN